MGDFRSIQLPSSSPPRSPNGRTDHPVLPCSLGSCHNQSDEGTGKDGVDGNQKSGDQPVEVGSISRPLFAEFWDTSQVVED